MIQNGLKSTVKSRFFNACKFIILDAAFLPFYVPLPGGSEAGNWWLPRGIIFTWECDRLFRAVGSRKDVIKMGQPCGRKTAGL